MGKRERGQAVQTWDGVSVTGLLLWPITPGLWSQSPKAFGHRDSTLMVKRHWAREFFLLVLVKQADNNLCFQDTRVPNVLSHSHVTKKRKAGKKGADKK